MGSTSWVAGSVMNPYSAHKKRNLSLAWGFSVMHVRLLARNTVRAAFVIRYVADTVFCKLFWSHLLGALQWNRLRNLALTLSNRNLTHDWVIEHHVSLRGHIVAHIIIPCIISVPLPIRIESFKSDERAYGKIRVELPNRYPCRTKSVGIALVMRPGSTMSSFQ